MAIDVGIRFKAEGTSGVIRQFRNVGSAIDASARKGVRLGRVMRSTFGGVSSQVRTMAAAFGGLSIVMGARKILSFDEKLAQIQVNAKFTNKEILSLKARMIEVGQTFRQTPEDMAGAAQVFQDFGGILKGFGEAVIPTVAKFARATGSLPEEGARIASVLHKQLGLNATEVAQAFAMLKAQSDAGTIALDQLATVLPEVLSLSASLGVKGMNAVQQFGTALQVIGETGGGVEETRTRLKGLIRVLTDVRKAETFKKLGIKIFDKKDGKTVLRDVTTLMSEIMDATDGKLEGRGGLLDIFRDERAKVGMMAFFNTWDQQTKKFRKKGLRGATTADVLAAGAGASPDELDKAIRTKQTGVGASADKVKGATTKIQGILQSDGAKLLATVAENPVLAAALGVSGFVAFKGGKHFIKSMISRRGGGVGGTGGRPMPVFVTNFPGATISPTDNVPTGPPGGSGFRRRGTSAERLSGASTTLALGFALGTALDQWGGISDEFSTWAASLGRRERQEASTRQFTRMAGGENLQGLARTLAQLGRSGQTSFETEPGKRVALTQANALEALRRNAERMGVTQEQFSALKPIFEQILSVLKRRQNARGIDRDEVSSQRGMR